MSGLSKRLEALESSRTPQQIVSSHVQRRVTLPTMDAWLQDIGSESCKTSCLQSKQVFQRRVKRGSRDLDERRAELGKINRETTYLTHLSVWPCQRLEQERYRYLFEESNLVILQLQFIQQCQARLDCASELHTAQQIFQTCWESLLITVQALELAEQKISQAYFNGQNLLLDEQKAFLTDRLACLQQGRDVFEQTLAAVGIDPSFSGDDDLTHKIDAMASWLESKAKQDAKMAVYELEERHLEMLELYRETVSQL